mmetsp:Transcript_15144/g.43739  ORF Transcript_15144/g.43739 Transcript_15144/m.43739 type:complete len:81 (+) Transcript_15144:650-892(+)
MAREGHRSLFLFPGGGGRERRLLVDPGFCCFLRPCAARDPRVVYDGKGGRVVCQILLRRGAARHSLARGKRAHVGLPTVA